MVHEIGAAKRPQKNLSCGSSAANDGSPTMDDLLFCTIFPGIMQINIARLCINVTSMIKLEKQLGVISNFTI